MSDMRSHWLASIACLVRRLPSTYSYLNQAPPDERIVQAARSCGGSFVWVMTRGLSGRLIREKRRRRWFVADATARRLALNSRAPARSRLRKGPPGRPDDQRTEPTSQERSR